MQPKRHKQVKEENGSVFDITSQKLLSFDDFTTAKDESETQLYYWLRVKTEILIHALITVTFLLGLSSTLVRYFQKLFHRLMTDGEKFYNCSYWLAFIGNIYICYIFTSFWAFGALSNYKLLKTYLVVLNVIGIFAVKVVFIEASQSVIMRDIAIMNICLASYVLSYPCSFPYFTMMTFTVYYVRLIVCRHFLDLENSAVAKASVEARFKDPDLLEELIRLNMDS